MRKVRCCKRVDVLSRSDREEAEEVMSCPVRVAWRVGSTATDGWISPPDFPCSSFLVKYRCVRKPGLVVLAFGLSKANWREVSKHD